MGTHQMPWRPWWTPEGYPDYPDVTDPWSVGLIIRIVSEQVWYHRGLHPMGGPWRGGGGGGGGGGDGVGGGGGGGGGDGGDEM